LRLVLADLLEITGVGHHGGALFKGIKLVHQSIISVPARRLTPNASKAAHAKAHGFQATVHA
jgi:hypothetical protein